MVVVVAMDVTLVRCAAGGDPDATEAADPVFAPPLIYDERGIAFYLLESFWREHDVLI